MSKKELQEMKKGLKLQHAEVTRSKSKAKKLLLDLKLITPKGNLTKVFKAID
jgi:hypothetical protein